MKAFLAVRQLINRLFLIMRVFCRKWFYFYPGCLLLLPLLLKIFKIYNVLLLHGLPNSHIGLPLEYTPMGIPIKSTF